MASFLELIDNTLGTHFATPVYDPKAGRAKFVKVIDKAAEQHKEGKTPPTRSWKLGNNNAISFSPTLNGNPVVIGKAATNYVPAERFQDFLKGLKAEVEKGGLDSEIKKALESDGPKASSGPRAARGQGLGRTARPDDADWMAKFREKVGEPDASIVDPVPNSKGSMWISRANAERGQAAAAKRHGR